MRSTVPTVLATVALLVAAPVSAQGPAGLVPLASRIALDRADATPVRAGRLYTVRVSSFADPGGAVSERVADELRAAAVPVRVRHVMRRGRRMARLEIGAVTTRAQAEALQRKLRFRLSWPTYVARKDAGAVTPQSVRASLALLAGG